MLEGEGCCLTQSNRGHRDYSKLGSTFLSKGAAVENSSQWWPNGDRGPGLLELLIFQDNSGIWSSVGTCYIF